MFGNFDERTMKFIILIAVIAVIFSIPFGIVSKKTPKAGNEYSVQTESISEEDRAQDEEQMNEEVPVSSEEEMNSESEDEPAPEEVAEPQPEEQLEPLENLPEEAAEVNQEEAVSESTSTESMIARANTLRREKDYVRAIDLYNRAAESTDDTLMKAQCYENMSTVYAIMKRYGSALSFAQKAYNMAPSTNRELLLARLYYKLGDIDKATRRVNNILQRDFSVDK